jgi:hexosaminidase
LPSKAFPKLTSKKHFTYEQIAEMNRYAKARGVLLVPEFECPGHARSLNRAYPEVFSNHAEGETGKFFNELGAPIAADELVCAGSEIAFEGVKTLLAEIVEMFPDAPYIHIGGDEAPSDHWKACPYCQKLMRESGVKTYSEYQNLFMNKVIDYLESKGRHAIVWNEAAKGENLDKRALVQYWKEDSKPTVKFLNEGGRAILSPFSYYYLDYDYSITPLNRVYSLKASLPGLTDAGKKNIIGLESPIWTEYIDNNQRLEELLFPRIIAVSKSSLGENQKSYKEFMGDVKALQKQLPDISFMPEKEWTKPRLSMVSGWLRFAKDHYTLDFIKEQLSK